MKQSELLFAYYMLPLVPMKAWPQIGCRIMASFSTQHKSWNFEQKSYFLQEGNTYNFN